MIHHPHTIYHPARKMWSVFIAGRFCGYVRREGNKYRVGKQARDLLRDAVKDLTEAKHVPNA